MKEQAEKTTLYKKGGIGKSLRLIITGALVATFFNCSLMAYADEGDPGDGNGGSATVQEVQNTSGSDQQNGSKQQNPPVFFEDPFDPFKDIVNNITTEIGSISNTGNGDHSHGSGDYLGVGHESYGGIHLSFNGNAPTNATGEVQGLPEEKSVVMDSATSRYNSSTDLRSTKYGYEADEYKVIKPTESPYMYCVDENGNLVKMIPTGSWEPVYDGGKVVAYQWKTKKVDGKIEWTKTLVADKGKYVADIYKEDGKLNASGYYVSNNNEAIAEFEIPGIDESPALEGYTFLGWSTDKNATTGEIKPGTKVSRYFCSVLYAIWGLASPETPLPPVTPEPDEPEGFAPIVPGFTVPSDPTPPADGGNGGGGVRVAPLTSLGDDGTPMGVFDTGHGIYCWVHWWILLGTLITVAMSVLVLNRRERYISKLNKVERDILEERTGATVADPSFVPVGVSA